jgi:hypothetical protein
MKPVAAILFCDHNPPDQHLLKDLSAHPLIEKVILLKTAEADKAAGELITLAQPFPRGGNAVAEALRTAQPCPFMLLIPFPRGVSIVASGIERFVQRAQQEGAGLYYADYYEDSRDAELMRSVLDYQSGSIRDDFFFGPLLFCSSRIITAALEQYGPLRETNWGGLYDLRLRISRAAEIARIAEPLSRACEDYRKHCGQAHFDYVDPSRQAYQSEMEEIATDHLKSIGAYIAPGWKPADFDTASYPVEASVVIPVRNREKTIGDAIASALGQKTSFSFNVIVVENHSTDLTGEKIAARAEGDSRVVMIVPDRTDLGIGGCWNEAVFAPQCGRYVCQLDSDDLYADEHTLSAMVGMLKEGSYGMVVGSYRVVNFSLQDIPPGLVEHREWTEENGRNNLLRVHGIGAPRAFPTSLLRRFPFPNVSYGEDYAAALRISREYRVGRIFTPLYLCRRWEGNSDANLSYGQENRYASYKDSLRTQEILERIRVAAEKGAA